MLSRVLACLTAVALLASPYADAAPSAVGKFKDWTVFTETVGTDTLCYAATAATDMAPKSAEHGEVWFYVASWRSGKAKNQPSLKVGYELRADLPGKVRIGRESWPLFGVGREAFSQDGDDPKLVSALRRGTEVRVEAVSGRNTRVTYHFSLSGSSTAIDRAAQACR